MSESALALPAQCRSGIDCFVCSLSSTCRWDLDCDGKVDGADLGILQLTWSGDNVCSIETPMCVACGGEGAGAGAFAGGGEGVAGSDAGIAAELEAALFFAGFQSIEAYVAWALEAPPSDVNAIGQFVHDILNSD